MKIARIENEAHLPTRRFETDAGADLYAFGNHRVAPHSYGIVRTGITVEVPAGCMLLLKPKSRNNHLVGAGVVDEGYQGEILVKIVNYSDDEHIILDGAAIAQMVVVPVIYEPLEEVALDAIHTNESLRSVAGGIVEQTKDE